MEDRTKCEKWIMDVVMVLVGNFINAAGIAVFVVPSGLIMGGVTGLSLAVCRAFGLATGTYLSLVVGVINVILFLAGLILLGRAFALKTLVSTVSFPIFLGLIEGAMGDFVLTDDLLLCAVFGGAAIGASFALVMRQDASTGGLDIVSLSLHKYLGLPISPVILACDGLVLLSQSFFSARLGVLYGILLVVINSATLDKLLSNGESRTEIEVVSDKVDDIRNAVISQIDRSCTLYYGESGYLGEPIRILKVVVSAREIHKTERFIKRIDPTAFMTLTKVSRVSGRGFTLARKIAVESDKC